MDTHSTNWRCGLGSVMAWRSQDITAGLRLTPDKFYKGSQEKTLHLWPEFFLPSSPSRLSRIVLGFRSVISGRYEQSCSDCGFLYQRFSSLLCDEASPF